LTPVWSKNPSSLGVSKKLKFFNGDELMEGTGNRIQEWRDEAMGDEAGESQTKSPTPEGVRLLKL